jgi:hypothetical protein
MTPKELGLCQDRSGRWMAFCGNEEALALRNELIRSSWHGGKRNLARVREIGEALHALGGQPLLETVANDYAALGHEQSGELLEIHWDGIGSS